MNPPSSARVRGRIAATAVMIMVLLGACTDATVGDTNLVDSGATPSTQVVRTTAPADQDAAPAAEDDGAEVENAADGDEADAASGEEDEADTEAAVSPTAWTETSYNLVTIASLAEPIGLTHQPGSTDLWLIERAGRVRLIERSLDEAAGTEALSLVSEPVLDITSQVTTEGEGGLLGIAFDADGENLYLHYTSRNGGANVISEFPMSPGSDTPGDERVLLTIPEPYSNHNGGDLAFSPTDGHLYISLGDGGAGGDPEGNGQDSSTLLGSILRIDPAPSAELPYTIPADNPFVGSQGSRPEIWVWGLRNPWRMSFDAEAGDLWIGDVGQELFEEVTVVSPNQGGANLGWNLIEGTETYGGPAPENHLPPLYTYSHDQGRCSITGGYVYRGRTIPALDGVYLFADFCVPGVAGIRVDGEVLTAAELSLDRRPETIISFGEGSEGEIYVMEAGGQVSRIQGTDWPWTTTVQNEG